MEPVGETWYNEGVEAAFAASFHIDADGARIDMEPHADRTTPTSLYRYYDSAGVLIYVGITSQRIARNRQHNGDKIWWQWVASQKIDHFSSAREAHAAEVRLIQKFRPPFNKQHNPDHSAMSTAYTAARNGDAFWSVQLSRMVTQPEAFAVGVFEPNWRSGEISLRPYADSILAAAPLALVDKRPITTTGGNPIGNVYALERDGMFTVIKGRVKQPWRFTAATVYLKKGKEFGSTVIKRVVAEDLSTRPV